MWVYMQFFEQKKVIIKKHFPFTMLSFDYTVSKLDTLKKSQQDSMTTREEVERKEAVAKLRIKQRAEVGYNSSLHTGRSSHCPVFAYCK